MGAIQFNVPINTGGGTGVFDVTGSCSAGATTISGTVTDGTNTSQNTGSTLNAGAWSLHFDLSGTSSLWNKSLTLTVSDDVDTPGSTMIVVPRRVQVKTASSNGTSTSATWDNATTAGSLLVAVVNSFSTVSVPT